jgi:hypothetical protein
VREDDLTVVPDRRGPHPKGMTVGFLFGKSPIRSGAESRFCFVLTDAAGFDAKAGSLEIITDDGSKVTCAEEMTRWPGGSRTVAGEGHPLFIGRF